MRFTIIDAQGATLGWTRLLTPKTGLPTGTAPPDDPQGRHGAYPTMHLQPTAVANIVRADEHPAYGHAWLLLMPGFVPSGAFLSRVGARFAWLMTVRDSLPKLQPDNDDGATDDRAAGGVLPPPIARNRERWLR